MKRPSQVELDTALAWLRSNEGDEGEKERCAAVADWIEHLDTDAILRSEARKAGVSLKALRQRLAANKSVQQ